MSEVYIGGVRYAEGGGLDARGRARREAVRLQAVDLFEQQVLVPVIAKRLRVSTKSVYVWRQAWRASGRAGLVSKGPSGTPCRLNERQLVRLERELDAGPAAHGWAEDQRWTLPRVTVLIGRPFHVRYTQRGVSYLLHRMTAGPRRFRRIGPSNGTRPRSSRGGRRRGRGSDLGLRTGGVDLLRG